MIKNCKLLTGLGLAYCMLVPTGLAAQTTPEPTPRQVFVSFLTGIPAKDVRFKTQDDYVPEHVPEDIAPPPAQDILPSLRRNSSTEIPLPPALPEAPLAIPAPEVVEENSIEVSERDLLLEKPVALGGNDIQPFYVSAEQYLGARGDAVSDQIVLEYEVTPINKVLGLSANPKMVKLVIGPDFAAVTREGKTRIFDFKMRRLLTQIPGEAVSVFDNTSLFPIALNNIETVKGATKNGSLSEIQVAPDKTLDAFWMEASLGWSARHSIDTLRVSYIDDLFSAEYDGEIATRLNMNGPVLISEKLRGSLFAFFHHDVPIHPLVLKELGLPLSVPSRIETLSFSPNYPNGLKTVWVLKNSETVSQPFPLSTNSRPLVSEGKGAPIEFAIYNHVLGKIKPNRVTDDDLRQTIFNARTSGQSVKAWIVAKELESRLGGCDADPALLCQDIKELEAAASPESDLGRLLWATQDHDIASIRVIAFEILMGYVRDGEAPAFLVKSAGQMRARIKSRDLTSEALRSVRADRLLEEALAKNPNDPETYRTLSQVYAAQKRYAESWNLQDAMRRLPDVNETLTRPIKRVENSLINQAPAFFAPENP